MKIDNRLLLLLAVAAGATGAALAWSLRGRHHRAEQHLNHKEDIRSWENEGGNLAPPPWVPLGR